MAKVSVLIPPGLNIFVSALKPNMASLSGEAWTDGCRAMSSLIVDF
jgi:hypothetical protein